MVTVRQEAISWVERLARLGYAAKGVVYTIVGVLAVLAAGGSGDAPEKKDVFTLLIRQPFGRTMLLLVAAGLAGYAVWRISNGLLDSERRGTDAKGLAIRTGGIIRGLAHAGLTFELVRFVMRRDEMTGDDSQARHWTAQLLEQPFGRWLVALAAAGIAGYGLYQLYSAVTSRFSSKLQLNRLSPSMRRPVTAISRFGIGARGVVFLLIGYSVARAALNRAPGQAHGLGGALRDLAQQPFGSWLVGAAGVGLIAYGIYAFVNAKVRMIDAG